MSYKITIVQADIKKFTFKKDNLSITPSFWILVTGIWRDHGVWDDNSNWID